MLEALRACLFLLIIQTPACECPEQERRVLERHSRYSCVVHTWSRKVCLRQRLGTPRQTARTEQARVEDLVAHHFISSHRLQSLLVVTPGPQYLARYPGLSVVRYWGPRRRDSEEKGVGCWPCWTEEEGSSQSAIE